jgi:2'-5' RNA ligase
MCGKAESPMRLFVALDLDDSIRQQVQQFLEKMRLAAPAARWVKPESLHITLKFIGEQPTKSIDQLTQVLASVRAPCFALAVQGFGFFPNPRSARVFWVGIQAPVELTDLAKSIDQKMATFGIAREEHAFNPHLTLARRSGQSGAPRRQRNDAVNSDFARLQAELCDHPAPLFGSMTAREFFLYRSELSPRGSRYTKLERFPLQPQ